MKIYINFFFKKFFVKEDRIKVNKFDMRGEDNSRGRRNSFRERWFILFVG